MSEAFFDNLLTMEELLALFKNRYSKYTIYKWVQYDNMPCHKIKGKLWFPKKEVYHWFLQGGK